MRLSARRPLLALVLAVGLLLGACAGDGELGGPALGGTLAAKVGAVEFSNADLEDEVEIWASNPAFLSLLQITDLGAPGRRSSALVTFVLSNRLVSEQARQISAGQGVELTDDEVSQIVEQVSQNFIDPSTGAAVFELFPEAFRQRLGADLAYQSQLQSVDPSTVDVPDVQVNPRYGDLQLDGFGFAQVEPPAGPQPAPALIPEAQG